jgi:uncharacterized membrane protein YdjX (TVP38/TMEM64 family)
MRVALARLADPGVAGVAPVRLGPAILKALVLLVLLAGAALVLRRTGIGMLHAIHPGWGGAALLIGLGGTLTALGVPRQALAMAGGYAFGALAGGAISLAGQILGCVLDYVAARGLAAGLAQRVLARPAAQRVHRLLVRHPFTATLTLRLLPLGSNVVMNVLAGASRVNPVAFFGASLLGYVPQTVVFALLGSGTQVGKGMQMAVGVALFACASVLGVVLYRRTRPPVMESAPQLF